MEITAFIKSQCPRCKECDRAILEAIHSEMKDMREVCCFTQCRSCGLNVIISVSVKEMED